MILLDSNVFSALMTPTPNPNVERWINSVPSSAVWTTSVTVYEIELGIESLPAGRRQSNLRLSFESLRRGLLGRRIAPFDTAAAECAGMLAAERKRLGRNFEERDTMIAGIAIAIGATIATRNTRHFIDIAVPVVNPWE
jgi:predicted nucleic acid-binding protein